MQVVKKKISAKDGATILLALLFFLLCAVAGSIVLAAGSAASGRVSGLAEQEQSFYTVTSAAKVMRDEMMATTTVTDDGVTKLDDESSELSSLINTAASEVFTNRETAGYTGYTDTLTISTGNGEFPQIKGEFRMDIDYSITLVLYQSSDEDKDTYVCKLVVPTSITEIGSGDIKQQITWTKGKISKGR